MIDQHASTRKVEVVGDTGELANRVRLKKNNNSAEMLEHSASHPMDKLVILSPREKEIVRLVAKGLPNKTIAAILDISPWTVATHIRRVFGKLGVRSRAAMIAAVFHH